MWHDGQVQACTCTVQSTNKLCQPQNAPELEYAMFDFDVANIIYRAAVVGQKLSPWFPIGVLYVLDMMEMENVGVDVFVWGVPYQGHIN